MLAISALPAEFDLFQFSFKVLPLVLRQAHAARELVGIDDDPFDPRGDFQRIVFDVLAGATKDGVQQFLFGRQFGFAFGADLADQDVAGFDIGTDLDDPVLVQVSQRFLTNIGDIASEFLASQFGFADFDVKVLDVN